MRYRVEAAQRPDALYATWGERVFHAQRPTADGTLLLVTLPGEEVHDGFDREVVVDLIGSTTTTTGLTVHCVLDTAPYPIGVKHTKKDVDNLPITRHDFDGEWNYTLVPATRP